MNLALFVVLFKTFSSLLFHPISSSTSREKRLLNLFTVIRFPNTPCRGNAEITNRNGTCFTELECANRGGSNGGICAGGFGICCIFSVGCGGMSSHNCTYFEGTGETFSGSCRATICRCNDNICQLRLDFENFIINGPSTATVSTGKVLGASVFPATQCIIDQFAVTNPSGDSPPVICGQNSGEHMYVDAADSCNDLAFTFGDDQNAVPRSWTIKVSQYSCDFNNLAPDGCTQYFFGQTSDTVQTFNFAGGHHLASQNQLICVRRENNICQICWTTSADGDFETSTGMTGASGTVKMAAGCCSLGTNGNAATGFDCAVIPGASKSPTAATITRLPGSALNFCGGKLGTIAGATDAKTVCSMSIPFQIRFISDLFEFTDESTKTPNGFSLNYILMMCS